MCSDAHLEVGRHLHVLRRLRPLRRFEEVHEIEKVPTRTTLYWQTLYCQHCMANTAWPSLNGQHYMVNTTWPTLHGQHYMVNTIWPTLYGRTLTGVHDGCRDLDQPVELRLERGVPRRHPRRAERVHGDRGLRELRLCVQTCVQARV